MIKIPRIMACGCAENTLVNGVSGCGLHGEIAIATPQPDVSERKAKCSACGELQKSGYKLPFFRYREKESTDSFYCGCRGWD